MHVSHVVSGLFVGGAQVGVVRLVKKMAARNIARNRVCTLGKPIPFFERAESRSLPEYDGRDNNPWILWRSSRALRKMLKLQKPEMVQSHGWDADLITALAIAGLPARHVSHIRSIRKWAEVKRASKKIRLFLARVALRRSNARFIAVLIAVKEQACTYLGWSPASVGVVPDDADVEQYIVATRKKKRGTGASDILTLGTAARISR